MNVEELAGLLAGAREGAGGEWNAACPACEKKRKLYFREKEGTLLLHCFRGCTLEEITSALGISIPDLLGPSEPIGPSRNRRAAELFVRLHGASGDARLTRSCEKLLREYDARERVRRKMKPPF